MKKTFAIWLIIAILTLGGCKSADTIAESQSNPPTSESISQTESTGTLDDAVFREEGPEFSSTEPVSQTDLEESTGAEPSASTQPSGTVPTNPTPPAGNRDSEDATDPAEEKPSDDTQPPHTQPTDPPATKPSEPKETIPPTTEPSVTDPPVTEPPQTEPEATETEATEPAGTEITYEFKRQVAAAAVKYINQYRGSSCTVLSGMSNVAQYRASQLTWNYGHSTADKRAALAYYEYGRYIDATEFGDDASNSYWEADSAEAICAGFYGTDPNAMGKKIADLIKNSSGHWSYIGSSEYSYIGVGVEYREGSEYGWYCCVMVGKVNYG